MVVYHRYMYVDKDTEQNLLHCFRLWCFIYWIFFNKMPFVLNPIISDRSRNHYFVFFLKFSGFQCLHGTSHKISHIDLHSNCINNIDHLVQCTKGLHWLTNLTLEKNGKANPVCHTAGMDLMLGRCFVLVRSVISLKLWARFWSLQIHS